MKYHLENMDDSYPEYHKKIVDENGVPYADLIGDVVSFNGGTRFGIDFLRGIVEAVETGENKKEKKTIRQRVDEKRAK